MCHNSVLLLFVLFALPIAVFLPPMAECRSTGHVLVKRSMDPKWAAELLKELEGKPLDNVMRQRLVNIAAFVYSILATYLPRNPLRSAMNEHDLKFGNNITSDPMADIVGGMVPEEFTTFFRPPADGTLVGDAAERKDVQCFAKCFEEMTEKDKRDGKLHCSDVMEFHDCIVRCQKQSGGSNFTKFMLTHTDHFNKKYCPHRDIKLDSDKAFVGCNPARLLVLAISYAFDFGKQFVDEFKAGQQCSAVKRILVDELAKTAGAICDKPEQSELIENVLHILAGYSLAHNTDGAIFKRCPAIYETNF